MRQAPERQRGAIIVLTLLFLVMLLGFAALALDLGRLYVLRTEMQNAADASAMAAAAELDRQTNSIADAVIAGKELLSHRGRFATNPELLNILNFDPTIGIDPTLSAEQNAFEFYSWINAELDDVDPPAGCIHPLHDDGTEDTDKCLTNDDTQAHYVRVRLYPELVIDEEEYFQISLYFLPVLGLFLEDGTITTAATRVTAVSGAGAAICNYPPMFMCSADESDPDGGMTIGQQVRIKMQMDNWTPGNFGFLIPPEIQDPIGGGTLNGNQALAAALANEKLVGCTPSVVRTNPGNNVAWTRHGLNTRFGIYNSNLFLDGGVPHPFYASAPNVISYPRDRQFEDADGTLNIEEGHFGRGWSTSLDPGATPPLDTPYIPSTYNHEEYFESTQPSGSTWPPTVSGFDMTNAGRFNLYQWELSGTVTPLEDSEWTENTANNCNSLAASCPSFNLESPRNDLCCNNTEDPPIDETITPIRDAYSCLSDDPDYNNPKNRDCTLLDGPPLHIVDNNNSNDTYPIGTPAKRVLFVALIRCNEAGISLNGASTFDALEYGSFIKMFLTEHIQPPSGGPTEKVDVYTEYLGPVNDRERQELVHTTIQLYE